MIDNIENADYVLVTEVRDYADEFDTHGFVCMTKEDYLKIRKKSDAALVKALEANGGDVERYFGTNECHNYTSVEDYWESMTLKFLDETEGKAMDDVFDGYFGQINFPFDYEDYEEE
jgi:hypothetical protein